MAVNITFSQVEQVQLWGIKCIYHALFSCIMSHSTLSSCWNHLEKKENNEPTILRTIKVYIIWQWKPRLQILATMAKYYLVNNKISGITMLFRKLQNLTSKIIKNIIFKTTITTVYNKNNNNNKRLHMLWTEKTVLGKLPLA